MTVKESHKDLVSSFSGGGFVWNSQKMASLAKKEEECFPLGELPDTCLYEV